MTFGPELRREGAPVSVRETRSLLATVRRQPGTVPANEGHSSRVLALRRQITERLGHTPLTFAELTPDESASVWHLHTSDRVDFWEPAVTAKREQHARSVPAGAGGSLQPGRDRKEDSKPAPKALQALRRQAQVVTQARKGTTTGIARRHNANRRRMVALVRTDHGTQVLYKDS